MLFCCDQPMMAPISLCNFSRTMLRLLRQVEAEQLRGLAAAGHRAGHVAHAEDRCGCAPSAGAPCRPVARACGMARVDGGEGALEVGHQRLALGQAQVRFECQRVVFVPGVPAQ